MITFLEIENILLIKKTTLEFKKGLCIFTGETGAGKSIILNSILFLLGKKIKTDTKDILRAGESVGHITGSFDIKENLALKEFLQEKGLKVQDELIIKRILKKGEKERSFLNGDLISSSILPQIGNFLIEVNRQNEQITLLDKSFHIKMLDMYAEVEGNLSLLQNAYKSLIETKNEIKKTNDLLEKFKNDKEYIEGLIQEIESLELEENEEQALLDKKIEISKALKEVQAVNECSQKLFFEKNIRSAFISALKMVKMNGMEEESPLELSLNRILNEIDLLEDLLNASVKNGGYTEYDLDKTNERLFLIRDIARKYKLKPDELNQFLLSQKAILNEINFSDDNLKKLQAREAQLLKEYYIIANELSAKRKLASSKLEEFINGEFEDLEMKGANFKVEFKQNGEGVSSLGIDEIEFVISTNIGMKHSSLAKVASGGELSRILLAIKIAMLKVNMLDTIIFDEIDAGIGGKTSTSVALKLLELSKKVQIILITHQAQIASKANLHFKIEKFLSGNLVETAVKVLNGEERELEIARMLSGSHSKQSIDNAKAMLYS